MVRRKKKKLRIKKKNFTIFIVTIILIIASITYGIKSLINVIQTPNSNKEEIKTIPKTKKEKNLEKLENIDKKIKYFNYSYIDRYLNYKDKNQDLSTKDIITRVNIGIDKEPYTNKNKAKYPNKSYILVNKYNYLENDYVPINLESISNSYALSGMKLVNYAKEAYEKMAKDAEKENLSIIAMSSYRSYDYQVNLYNKYKDNDGEAAADTYSGRPGFSEHQTGLAVDVYNGEEDYTNFEKTKEFTWMQENAYKYGFILRFPKNKENLTGYIYESWHYRYVGIKIATYIHENNLCFEEYYVQNIDIKK